jgi:hypothetical protein
MAGASDTGKSAIITTLKAFLSFTTDGLSGPQIVPEEFNNKITNQSVKAEPNVN